MTSTAAPEATPDHSLERSVARRWLTRLGIVAAIAAVVALVATSGVLDLVRDEAELEAMVSDAGLWGPVLFLGLMVLLVPLNVPGLLFVIPSTTLFGTVPGIALSLVGGVTASMVGVVAARRLGRDRFASRLPDRVQRMEVRISERGFWAVVTIRMVSFLFQPADWLCGLSSMRLRTVVLGTTIGLIPPTLVIALTGGGLFDLLL